MMNAESNVARSLNVQNSDPNDNGTGLETFFSPRQVASAIGVSESSLKRWCDRGTILSTKTAGGHRRMTRSNVVEFLRQKSHQLHKPDAIGLPDITTVSIASHEEGISQLYDAVVADDQQRCRELLHYLYINETDIAQLFDQIVAPLFSRIGENWKAGQLEIYQERRACEMFLNVFRELKQLLPALPETAPLAIGASPAGDHYMLPTTAVEMTFIANGWDARSLGSNIPFGSLLSAARDYNPALVWISISNVEDEAKLISEFNQFSTNLSDQVVLITGGQALTPTVRSGIKNTLCCDNLSQLVSTMKNLRISRNISTSQPSENLN